MLKRTTCVIALLCGLLLLGGCSTNLARFTIASTNNVQTANLKKGNIIEGEDCITDILGIPIGSMNDRISRAVANALEAAHSSGQPAEALINVEISMRNWTVILFGQSCVIARGQPVSTSSK